MSISICLMPLLRRQHRSASGAPVVRRGPPDPLRIARLNGPTISRHCRLGSIVGDVVSDVGSGAMVSSGGSASRSMRRGAAAAEISSSDGGMGWRKSGILIVFIAATIVAGTASPAWAYMDPSAGGLLFQILAPIFAVITVGITFLRRQIGKAMSRLFAPLRRHGGQASGTDDRNGG
jgi:hypothetical protein